MPVVDFKDLPAASRVWVFASDKPLTGSDATKLLATVDGFLAQWKAHGAPLRSAREWRDDRFLAIGVDPTAEQASGCSIDGLFRGLRELERELSTTLVAGGRVFYRDGSGSVTKAARKVAFGRGQPDPAESDAIASLAGSLTRLAERITELTAERERSSEQEQERLDALDRKSVV